ncbi:hypothetical protein C8Q72DRAFT_219218 [Fomitopsis betulina]|nr:hypothetical protein C8Q72DRAFT_219218 [Fomitopsis betulina]
MNMIYLRLRYLVRLLVGHMTTSFPDAACANPCVLAHSMTSITCGSVQLSRLGDSVPKASGSAQRPLVTNPNARLV